MRVVVVGAGLGGLSAAAHLAGSGHDVTVVERESTPGGRAGMIERDGFRLDNGPTVLTMPGLLEDTFAAASASMADFVTIKPVDPMYRAVYADGSTLFVRHGREAMTEEIRSFSGAADAAAFGPFCDWLERLYRAEIDSFIDANFDSPLDLVRPWRSGIELVRLGGFGKLAKRVGSFFEDERLQRIFSFQSMYAGLAPHDALALYAVITYMDSVEGVYVPEGGMHQMAVGLADALGAAGVEFRYDAPVTRILRRPNGRVTGVEVGAAERIEADSVVCNADLPVAYRELLPGISPPRAARSGTYSPSCLLWVAGVEGLPPPDAAHHNIHFGTDWDGAFKALIDDGVRMPDPSILVTLHSLDDPSLAPEGCSSLYVLEPMPNLTGRIDWTAERDRIVEDLRGRTAALGYPTDVVVEEIYDPTDWERMGMAQGTPFALAHTFFQTGPFRPNNVDKHVPGLVFAGSSTLPGVGVPMVLVSGKLAAERVEQYARQRYR
jgi:phytoene desaturase